MIAIRGGQEEIVNAKNCPLASHQGRPALMHEEGIMIVGTEQEMDTAKSVAAVCVDAILRRN